MVYDADTTASLGTMNQDVSISSGVNVTFTGTSNKLGSSYTFTNDGVLNLGNSSTSGKLENNGRVLGGTIKVNTMLRKCKNKLLIKLF